MADPFYYNKLAGPAGDHDTAGYDQYAPPAAQGPEEQGMLDEIARARLAQTLYGGAAYGSALLGGWLGFRPNRAGEIRGASDRMLLGAPGLGMAAPLAQGSVDAGNRRTGLEGELGAFRARVPYPPDPNRP